MIAKSSSCLLLRFLFTASTHGKSTDCEAYSVLDAVREFKIYDDEHFLAKNFIGKSVWRPSTKYSFLFMKFSENKKVLHFTFYETIF